MTENFLDFIKDTTKENFCYAQNTVFAHPEYNPYSKDLFILQDLLDHNKFQEVVDYNSINIVLSPLAHLFQNYALEKLKQEKDAGAELFFAQKIMKGVSLTGDGSKTAAYRVTRISDEKDILLYLEEEFTSQMLVKDDNKIYDLVHCKSGNKIYFDITTPYKTMQKLMDEGKIESPLNQRKKKNTQMKKWWKFW